MRLFKEPKNVDFSTKSEPWKEEDLAEFRILMNELKSKNATRHKEKHTKKDIKKQKKTIV